MPFGYLEFSRAIGREPCPIMRARAGGGGQYLTNRCQTSWTAKGCEPVGLSTVANLLDCQRVQTSWTAKGCEPVGRPMVASLLVCQRMRISWTANGCEPVGLPTVATFRLSSNLLAPPGRLYKELRFSIERHTNYNNKYTKSKHFSSLSL